MRKFLTTVLLGLSQIASGADLHMNAAVPQETQRVAPSTYSEIRLDNTLPSREYTIEAKVETHEIAPIDLEAARQKAQQALGKPPGTTPGVTMITVTPECIALRQATNDLLGVTDERSISAAVRKVQDARAKTSGQSCPADVLTEAALLRTMRRFDAHLPLSAGSFATVIAYRIEAGGTRTQVTQKVFDTGEVGAVKTHLVLGALPNRDQRWFSRKESDNKFIVTREANRRAFDPLGAALFTWQPAQDTSGWLQILNFRRGVSTGSWSAGIGLESSSPIYMFGYALNITDAFGLAAGYAGFNQQRLKGIYKGDGSDALTENLQPDQLMDKTFGGGWWVGITLRR